MVQDSILDIIINVSGVDTNLFYINFLVNLMALFLSAFVYWYILGLLFSFIKLLFIGGFKD